MRCPVIFTYVGTLSGGFVAHDFLFIHLKYLSDVFCCRFNVVWDDRQSENGELRPYKLLYFLQDDTIAVKVNSNYSFDPVLKILRQSIF